MIWMQCQQHYQMCVFLENWRMSKHTFNFLQGQMLGEFLICCQMLIAGKMNCQLHALNWCREKAWPQNGKIKMFWNLVTLVCQTYRDKIFTNLMVDVPTTAGNSALWRRTCDIWIINITRVLPPVTYPLKCTCHLIFFLECMLYGSNTKTVGRVC